MDISSGLNASTKSIPILVILEFGIVILVFLDTAIEEFGWCSSRSSSTSDLSTLIDQIWVGDSNEHWDHRQ
jgi:hypothetical protein